MSPTVPGMLLLAIIMGILTVCLIFHLHYFLRIAGHVKKTTKDRAFKKKDLMTALHICQGSNFNTVMLFSWNIFLVALAFLFFVIPDVLGTWSYFDVPQVASDSFGLAYFGVAVMILIGIPLALFVPQSYGYYQISRNLKHLALLTPIILLISISCSVYVGTIYPETNPTYWYMGYGALLISLGLMLAPIAKGYIEEMRI